MTIASIAAVKAQLSRYIRAVRDGEEVVVTDHNVPVARIVAADPMTSMLEIRKAREKPAELAQLRFTSRRSRKLDSLSFLLEERGVDR